ncbi:unnamed protein product [Ambrosiozyma monospora]|uniref:Unnamed protein product n=1 Tax=Ambrosiozyma monospora TaxID=43982 RepID=A0A9W6T1Q1_AMBMO|nr:unnamed protein product [Ambrosiozyma monospora]
MFNVLYPESVLSNLGVFSALKFRRLFDSFINCYKGNADPSSMVDDVGNSLFHNDKMRHFAKKTDALLKDTCFDLSGTQLGSILKEMKKLHLGPSVMGPEFEKHLRDMQTRLLSIQSEVRLVHNDVNKVMENTESICSKLDNHTADVSTRFAAMGDRSTNFTVNYQERKTREPVKCVKKLMMMRQTESKSQNMN